MPDYTLYLISGPLRFSASEDDAKRLAAELQSHNDEVVSLRAQVESLRENGDRLLAVADSAVEHQRDMIEAVAGPLRAEVDALKKNLDYLNADRENLRMFVSKGMRDGALDALQIVKLRAEVERMRRMPITDEQFAALNALRVAGEAQNKAIDMLKAEIESLRADADRYRWLREQHWHDGTMCVVVAPKQSVKLGADCPSGERLDALIYTARAAQGEQK